MLPSSAPLTNAQTTSDYKGEIKMLLVSPERLFTFWHTPKRKELLSQSP